MNHFGKSVVLVASLTSSLFVAQTAFGQVQPYTSETVFNTNVTDIDVRTFDSVSVPDDPGYVEFTTPALKLNAGAGSLLPSVTVTSSGASQVYVANFSGGFSQNYYLSRDFVHPNQTFFSVDGSVGVSAIGFKYGTSAVGGYQFAVTAFANADFSSPLSTVNVTLPTTLLETAFVGFASNTKIRSVLFQAEPLGGASEINFLQVSVGNALPVPEPSTYAMFGAGLALFGMIGRRRIRR